MKETPTPLTDPKQTRLLPPIIQVPPRRPLQNITNIPTLIPNIYTGNQGGYKRNSNNNSSNNNNNRYKRNNNSNKRSSTRNTRNNNNKYKRNNNNKKRPKHFNSIWRPNYIVARISDPKVLVKVVVDGADVFNGQRIKDGTFIYYIFTIYLLHFYLPFTIFLLHLFYFYYIFTSHLLYIYYIFTVFF